MSLSFDSTEPTAAEAVIPTVAGAAPPVPAPCPGTLAAPEALAPPVAPERPRTGPPAGRTAPEAAPPRAVPLVGAPQPGEGRGGHAVRVTRAERPVESAAPAGTVTFDTARAERLYRLDLRIAADRIDQVRRIATAYLGHWGLERQAGPMGKALAELLGNVVRHVGDGAPCTVELRLSGRRLTVSVADTCTAMPRRLPRGGGLARIGVLCESWGSCHTESGKVVWCTRRVDLPQGAAGLPGTPQPLLSGARPCPPPAVSVG
ncbi:ATP-binding protein [Streptomyces sp. NPDC058374]|uniref:ATP-binding protein n=1 Tax=Streptomyces sp. NPDC058374 TaxID=3346466 RepID=UPI0036675A41